jgi:hypothetical protein
MRGFTGYLLIGSFAALATSAITLSGFGIAISAHPVAEPGAVIQHVDRRHKSDRLDLPTQFGARPPRHQRPTVPVGCDQEFSPLSSVPTNPAGRCLT